MIIIIIIINSREEHKVLVLPQFLLRLRFGRVSDPSLAGGLVFYLVRGHTRRGCFHYIRCLNPFRVG